MVEKFPKSGNRTAKLTDEQKKSLCDILEEDCSRTIQRICDPCFESPGSTKGFIIGETCFQVNMIRRYGRELIGILATRICHALRSRNYSVSHTMSCEDMVNFKISESVYNAE
ncbi:hypothetical protein RF11_14569 [Thelohanellus kitauei]|nr:hypothetical protein RF11_14569 [Thelohanellus kitauei]